MKSILYITQYYTPEKGAASVRASDNIMAFSKLGHRVTVICPFSNYPDGKLPLEKYFKLYEKENIENITLYRLPILAFGRTRSIQHYLLYFSFVFTSFIFGLLCRKHDVIYCSSPPLFITLSAVLLSKIRRIKLVLEIRDLWPESVKVVNPDISSKLIYWAEKIEKYAYLSADKIVVVTKGFINHINNITNNNKCFFAPNGYNFTSIDKQKDISLSREDLNLDLNKVTIGYFGILGASQSLSFVVDVAEKITEIQFLILGFGNEFSKIENYIKNKKVTNVILKEAVQPEILHNYISLIDIFFVSLVDTPLFEFALPSKIFQGMALEKPMLCGVTGEAAKVIEDSESGYVFKPQNVDDCINKIKAMISEKNNFSIMGAKGKAYVQEHFNREIISKDISNLIESI